MYKKRVYVVLMLLAPILLLSQNKVKKQCEIEYGKLTPNSFSAYFSNCVETTQVFYLTGEHHHANSTNEITLAFIKYLIEERGLKYIFLEAGESYSDCLNRYLHTGDDDTLRRILKMYGRNNPSYFQLYKGIKELVDDEGRRIKFLGVDVEYDPIGAVNSILWNYGDLLLQDEKKALQEVKDRDINQRSVRREFYQIIEQIERRMSSSDEKALGRVEAILEGLENYRTNWMKRDLLMYEKIWAVYEREPQSVGYYSVGLAHMTKERRAPKNIRYYLAEGLGREKVYVSMINYHNCFRIDDSRIETLDSRRYHSSQYCLEKGIGNYDLWINVNCGD